MERSKIETTESKIEIMESKRCPFSNPYYEIEGQESINCLTVKCNAWKFVLEEITGVNISEYKKAKPGDSLGYDPESKESFLIESGYCMKLKKLEVESRRVNLI